MKSLERSVWKDWLRLKKELASHGKELALAKLSPAKRKKQSPDLTRSDTSKEEFGRRTLAGANMWDSLSCLLTLFGQHSQGTCHWRGMTHTHAHVNSTNGDGLNQTTFLTQAQALLGKAISKYTTQRNADGKSIINKDRQVAPKRMQLGVRLAVNTHNMGGRFVESVKIARWSMSPQEVGDRLESIVEFWVQIKGHNQRKYEGKWQG